METTLSREGHVIPVMSPDEQIISYDDLFAPTRAQCAAAAVIRACGGDAIIHFETEVQAAAKGLPATHS